MVDELSERQRRRKLNHFRNLTEAVFWFAGSFGLIVDHLTVHTAQSEEIVINVGDTSQTPPGSGTAS